MKRLICIFLSVMIAFSASGCKGTKQEVEKIGLVLAIGYDLTPDNKYKITFQVLNPEEDSSGGMSENKSGQQMSGGVMIYSSEGDTPYDALNHLSAEYGKNLFLGHSEYLVISKKVAEAGVSLVSDAISRGQQARPDNTLLLAKDTASEILEFKPSDEKIPAESVKNLIKLQSTRGYAPIISRLDFLNALSSKTAAPVLGVIDVSRKYNTGTAFKLAGTGVFKKDKLIGYLDMNETRGMQWIKGKVKDGVITAASQDGSGISFFLLNSSSQVKPIAENGSVTIQVSIKAESSILEMPAKIDIMKNPKAMDDLAKLQSEAIEKEANLAIYAAQKKLDADIFDFGDLIHRENPGLWKKLEHNWDTIYPDIKVKVTVNSYIRTPGLIGKPINQ